MENPRRGDASLITDCKVTVLDQPMGKLIAFAEFTVANSIIIKTRIMNGSKGPFVSYPSHASKGSKTGYVNDVIPVVDWIDRDNRRVPDPDGINMNEVIQEILIQEYNTQKEIKEKQTTATTNVTTDAAGDIPF